MSVLNIKFKNKDNIRYKMVKCLIEILVSKVRI